MKITFSLLLAVPILTSGAGCSGAADSVRAHSGEAPVSSAAAGNSAQQAAKQQAVADADARDLDSAAPPAATSLAEPSLLSEPLALAAQAAQAPAAPFSFPADKAGAILKERLTPPAPQSPPVESVEQPRAYLPPVERSAERLSPPPVVYSVPYAPRVADTERGIVNRFSPVKDLPPLELTAEPARASAIYLPIDRPKAFAAAPDAHQPPPLAPLSRPTSPPPAISDDPGQQSARVVTMPIVSATRPPAPPLVDFKLADPFELQREARLAATPPEADLPQSPIPFGPRVEFPIEPPADATAVK